MSTAPDLRPFRGWRLALSHHREHEAHHCLRLGPLALCARCLGLYPALAAVVALEGAHGPLQIPSRWFFTFLLPTPAVIDWASSRLYGRRGNNALRVGTGVLAGVGLGLAFADYFRDSNPVSFWALMVALAVVVLLVWRSSPAV